jgi:hypothetical protein
MIKKILMWGMIAPLFFVFGCDSIDYISHIKDHTFIGVDFDEIPTKAQLDSLDNDINPNIVGVTLDWNNPFPSALSTAVLNRGKILLIRWEPWIWGDENDISYKDILNGDWDEYIAEFAGSAKDVRYPLIIEFAPEFDSSGYSWSLDRYSNGKTLLTKTLNHVLSVFEREGAFNVTFLLSASGSKSEYNSKKIKINDKITVYDSFYGLKPNISYIESVDPESGDDYRVMIRRVGRASQKMLPDLLPNPVVKVVTLTYDDFILWAESKPAISIADTEAFSSLGKYFKKINEKTSKK